MKRFTSFTWTILLAGALLSGTFQSTLAQDAVKVGNDYLEKSTAIINSNNAEKISDLLTEDVIFYYGGGGEVHGKKDKIAGDASFFKNNHFKLERKAIEHKKLSKDFILTRGTSKGITTPKDGTVPYVWENNFIQLLKKDGKDWKTHRAVMYYTDEEPRRVRKADLFEVEDTEAYAIAQKLEEKSNLAWTMGDEAAFASTLTEDVVMVSEKDKNKADAVADFKKWTARYQYVTSSHITDVVQISDKMIYAMGSWEGNWKSMATGEAGVMESGEFIELIQKDGNDWKFAYIAHFKRGRTEKAGSIAAWMLNNYNAAMNTADISGIEKRMAEDAVFLGSAGDNYYGRESIVNDHKETFESGTAHQSTDVVDAHWLSRDVIFASGTFQFSFTPKDQDAAIEHKGSYSVLLTLEDNTWKFKRIMGYHQAGSDNIMAVTAPYLPKSDKAAMDIANDWYSRTAFAFANGSFSSDTWAKEAKLCGLNGKWLSKSEETNKSYEEDFAKFQYLLALKPMEAFFISEDVLYTMGSMDIILRNKETGETMSPMPGENIAILKKEDGKWRIVYGGTFRRGNAKAGVETASSE